MEKINVLLIEDNPGDARLIKEMLTEEKGVSFDVDWKDTLSKGLKRVAVGGINIILLDINLPDSSGFDTFLRTQAEAQEIPIILMTGLDDEDLAMKIISKGAQDYLVKGKVNSSLLGRSIRYAIERKRNEEALKNYALQLEEANSLKDLFTDIIRHDLLNPLGIIKIASEQMLLAEGKNESKEKVLTMIKNNTDKLIDMIRDASMYAMIASIEKIEKSNIDLNKTLVTVENNFKIQLDEKNMRLERLSNCECSIRANPLIESVFSNLLSNAIKYSPPGKKIEANIINKSERCKIYFKDWGYGIKDEDKLKLFNRFQRVDKKGVKGTGLGLAIVKRIVELHGGSVWIEDNPEGGSIFYVDIPKT